MILSYVLILPISQLQTQQLMTSQIRSHIFNADSLYSCAHFIFNIDEKLTFMTVLIRFNDDTFLGHPVQV